ncbi:GNAT family N-acetyltransferase [Phaeocystidibacter marisrubri]|uniref:GNAT family N-acetyltransferase n=2 Tax=Phaeocystidibacter marisrubri TaxID=1577780 RepID=A0A6L3ZKL0_9FLAO|nr:GNAT family N-acetyltransferase [Phaeocystidibacter marisrubri]
MEEIAPAADPALVRAELTEKTFLRYTNKGKNEVYIVSAHEAPNVMHEVGRLREEAFRAAGGGTGKALDIDQYDTSEFPYLQLVVWSPELKEIMAGYRLLDCRELVKRGGDLKLLATSHLFEFSEEFIRDYLPNTLELGRSFVQPKFQKGVEAKKGLFALDNLWDGLGGLIAREKDLKYLLGKVTMYPSYDKDARNALLGFLAVFFPDPDNLMKPYQQLVPVEDLQPWIDKFTGREYKEAYVELNSFVRSKDLTIPPLINSYMNLSDTMHTFGTMLNDEFGDVEETGILVYTDDVYAPKYDRHMGTYERDCHYGKPFWAENPEVKS